MSTENIKTKIQRHVIRQNLRTCLKLFFYINFKQNKLHIIFEIIL